MKKLPFITLPDTSNKTEIVKQIAFEDERYQATPVFQLTLAEIISRRKPKKKGNAYRHYLNRFGKKGNA